jgi:hypothetical protein
MRSCRRSSHESRHRAVTRDRFLLFCPLVRFAVGRTFGRRQLGKLTGDDPGKREIKDAEQRQVGKRGGDRRSEKTRQIKITM